MRRAFFAAAIGLASSCSDRTQALIRLETDLDLSRGELFVRMRARAADGTTDRSDPQLFSPGATFGVVPHGGLDQRVVVFADALDDANRLVATATRTIDHFEKGKTIELIMFLAKRCSAWAEVRDTCPEGQTCGACECEPDTRDVSMTPCPPPIIEDAGAPEDAEAGVIDADAGEPDAGVPDTGEPVPACTEGQACGRVIDCSQIVKERTTNGIDLSCAAGSGALQALCRGGACPLISEAGCAATPPSAIVACELACEKEVCVPGTPFVPDEYCAPDGETTETCKGYRCFFGSETQVASLSCESGVCTESSPSTCDGSCSQSDGCSD